ncbi:GNAT family N-acetyltransferase [Leptospira perolatii]|uniref:GNAT family N-acetyltransferase n=1 Tax=Leptospira perolatii TaxID=2023191 RepID=A0A2M9ZJ73_9LEPT|nr:GNAT family N-acetyltransferase [Leptospira perolatii]PJZ68177.1 GNAT family N-acetyltransferase [Leptospira perolatii]PJZ72072.1 GNAT family N-acetyltransferase [Leptospira perolatii]
MHFDVQILDSLQEIPRGHWESLEDLENPFSDYEFIRALENTGCVGKKTSWLPKYLVASDSKGLHSALLFFHKYDSYGEYIFDFAWANFFDQNGLSYYPKGIVAYPFTPVTGKRILRRSDITLEEAAQTLVPKLLSHAKESKLSGVHFLFLNAEEAQVLEKFGFSLRISHQYHWKNRDYENFEHFLGDFRSKKRMQIKRERELVRASGFQIRIFEGDDIKVSHIEKMYKFYTDTYSRKWGSPYLNLAFFKAAQENLRNRIVLVFAEKNGRFIAGTFNLRKAGKLYGRYWGSIEHVPFLHFECCFYTPIEYSIQNRIHTFEAGAQGEQKFLRGFPAVPTYSSHFIFDTRARIAIERFLQNERMYTEEMIEGVNEKSPLRERPNLAEK